METPTPQGIPVRLIGKRIKLYLRRNGFFFGGIVIDESSNFLVLDDEQSGSTRVFHLDEISNIEVLHG